MFTFSCIACTKIEYIILENHCEVRQRLQRNTPSAIFETVRRFVDKPSTVNVSSKRKRYDNVFTPNLYRIRIPLGGSAHKFVAIFLFFRLRWYLPAANNWRRSQRVEWLCIGENYLHEVFQRYYVLTVSVIRVCSYARKFRYSRINCWLLVGKEKTGWKWKFFKLCV